MMSMLSDVLTSFQEISLDDVHKRVPLLKQKFDLLKKETILYIENVYIKYSEKPKKRKDLSNICHQIEEEVRCLKQSAVFAMRKDLVNAPNTIIKNHVESLNEINTTLFIFSTLIKINDDLIRFNDLLDLKGYLGCRKLIEQWENTFDNISASNYMELYMAIEDTICEKKRLLFKVFIEGFKQSVSINKPKDNLYIFKVAKDIDNLDKVLFDCDEVVRSLENIKDLLWNHFFVPIVHNNVEIQLQETTENYILQITILVSTSKPSYQEVFANLELLLNFVNDRFCLKLNDNLTTMEYIGNGIRYLLLNLITMHCLEDTIPKTVGELEGYKTVLLEVEKLDGVLKQCKIIDESTISLVQYANNVNILFINKKCKEYLSNTIVIIKKHNVLVCKDENGLPVSKTVIELLQFCKNIMQEAINTSEAYAGRLFCTVQSIIMMYRQLVPEYHRNLFQAEPGQVALFLNDCFHIGDVLTQWNKRLCPKLPGIHSESKFDVTLHQIQYVASRLLADYIENEIKQMNTLISETVLDKDTFKVLPTKIEICLQRQESLKSAWQNVLPNGKYNAIMGKILNSFFLSILSWMVKVEEIPAKAVEDLKEVLTTVRTRCANIFSDPVEVCSYVQSWNKLGEINFVLGASLLDIGRRWDNGNGPLGQQFNASEVKSLVRAIFHDTDQRNSLIKNIL